MGSVAQSFGYRCGLNVIGKAVVPPVILLLAASLSVRSTALASTQATGCGMNGTTGKPGGVYGDQQQWVGDHVVQAISLWVEHPLLLGFHPGYAGGEFGQKVIWRVRKSLHQDVTVQGRNVRAGRVMRFGIVGAPGAPVQRIGRLELSRPSIGKLGRWRGYASVVSVPGPGCYVLRARWSGGGWTIHFNAETNRN